MTAETLIRELATKPEFRILSELGREISDKVRKVNFKNMIEKIKEDPAIDQELCRFRQELEQLGITSVEGVLVRSLSNHDLYKEVVLPISAYFLRKIPKD